MKHPNAMPKLAQAGFWQFLRELLIEAYNGYSFYESRQTADYTLGGTVKDELAMFNGTSAQIAYLPVNPKDGQTCTILRENTGAVTINGNGNTINGAATLSVALKGDSYTLIYSKAAGEFKITGKAETSMVPFDVAVAIGDIAGYKALNKFGDATDCDSGVKTDVWGGADGVTSTDIWVAPTAPRVHAIVSDDAADAAAGAGMRTMRVYGLVDWDTAETTEEITLNGVTPVNTANSYVIIHRMYGLTFGSGLTNTGTIKATAATDATITAVIKPTRSQSEMAIYGIPTTQTLAISNITASVLRNATNVTADGELIIINKGTDGGEVIGEDFNFSRDNTLDRHYDPPKIINGGSIIKFQVTTGTNGSEVAATFDGYLIDNEV